METVHTQVQLIKRGVERLIGEIELASKIERSTKSGKPLIIKLGVDPRKAEENVRGTVELPHGTGKTVRVLVLLW